MEMGFICVFWWGDVKWKSVHQVTWKLTQEEIEQKVFLGKICQMIMTGHPSHRNLNCWEGLIMIYFYQNKSILLNIE